jgi:hypothetical protein
MRQQSQRQRRARFLFFLLSPVAVILLITVGFPLRDSSAQGEPVKETVQEETPLPTLPPATHASEPALSGVEGMTAQPAPDNPPTVEPLVITQEPAESLSGDVPGILNKPLENPSEWIAAFDLMASFPVLAWKCENPDLAPMANATPELQALVAALNESRPAFDAAAKDLEDGGHTMRVSKSLVFTDDFANLPIAQTTDCKVQEALALFGSAPKSLPGEVGVIAIERSGTVEGKAAFERIWVVAWK